MIGVELRTRWEIFVKSWRRKCSFAYVSYSSKDYYSHYRTGGFYGTWIGKGPYQDRLGNEQDHNVMVTVTWCDSTIQYQESKIQCSLFVHIDMRGIQPISWTCDKLFQEFPQALSHGQHYFVSGIHDTPPPITVVTVNIRMCHFGNTICRRIFGSNSCGHRPDLI